MKLSKKTSARKAEKAKKDLPLFEPEWLERSLDRHYVIGLVFMVVLIAAFPMYRVIEPSLRTTALAKQIASYTVTGNSTFKTACAQCHGKDALGGGSAPTLNSKEFLGSISDSQMTSIIGTGVPGSSMSAWNQNYGGPLTQEQIREIVTYIRSLEPTAPSIPDWRKGVVATKG